MGKEELRNQIMNVIHTLHGAGDAAEDHLLLVLDILKLVNVTTDPRKKGLLMSTVLWVGKSWNNMDADLIQRYREGYGLGSTMPKLDTSPVEEEPAAESVKTKNTSLYLESFRF